MNKKYVVGMMAALAGFSIMSCEDQPDQFELGDGIPEIRFVRMATAEAADSLITGAYMNNTICLVGNNLDCIKELYFNDQKAILNTSYITKNTLLVDVPGEIPTVVSNKLFMITPANDTIDYDFSVLVPGPTVSSMSCEFARPGDEVTVYGDYFLDDPNVPLTVTMPDGQKPVIKSFDKYKMTFDIPQGCTEAGYIQVSSIYGQGRSRFQFHDDRNILFDWDGSHDGLTSGHGWRTGVVHADGTDAFSGIDGSYLYFAGSMKGDAGGTWDEDAFSFNYWPEPGAGYPALSDIPSMKAMLTNYTLGNLQVKFEVLIPSSNPWSSSGLQIIFSGNGDVTMGTASNAYLTNANLPRAIWLPWASSGSYDTGGEWITVSMPFSQFNKTHEGATSGGALNSDSFTGLTFFVYHGGLHGTDCEPVFAIDNIRVVPIE